MSKFRTQSSIIMDEIERQIENGLTDKTEIFAKVVEQLGVPRPTVRRCSRDLKTIWLNKVKVLSDDSRIDFETKKKLLKLDF